MTVGAMFLLASVWAGGWPQTWEADPDKQGDEDTHMLKCDHRGCPMWVHASCERVSFEEYDQFTNGTIKNHPLAQYVADSASVLV